MRGSVLQGREATKKDVEYARKLWDEAKNRKDAKGNLTDSAQRVRAIEADQKHTLFIHVGSKAQAKKMEKEIKKVSDAVDIFSAAPANSTRPKNQDLAETPGKGTDADLNFNPYLTKPYRNGPDPTQTVPRDAEATIVHEGGGHGFMIFNGLIISSDKVKDEKVRFFLNEKPATRMENNNRAARGLPTRDQIGRDDIGWQKVGP